jgi:tetratricopeptide (TPR) repeat protein
VLCGAYFFAGEPEAGRPFGQESVERARRLGDDVQLASSLLTYLMTIDPARSGPLYTEAIACTERSGDHLANSTLHDNAGADALAAGDLPPARAHLEAAAQAAQQIGRDSATLPADLGYVLRAEGDLDGARSAFQASLRIGRRNGDNWHMAAAILGLACLAGDAGDWDRAAALHGAAQAFRDRTGNPWHVYEARGRRDSLDQARAHLGDEQLERAYAQGTALSLDKALDLALGAIPPGT